MASNYPDGRRPTESSLSDMVDGAVRRIATSIAIAGVAIALAVYARPGPPRYQAFATDDGIVRIDTRSGTVIGCEGGRCMTLLRKGQRLAPNPNRNINAPRPEERSESPPAQKALPAPQPAPAPAEQTTPTKAPAPAT